MVLNETKFDVFDILLSSYLVRTLFFLFFFSFFLAESTVCVKENIPGNFIRRIFTASN